MPGESPNRRRYFRIPSTHYVLVRKEGEEGLPKLAATRVASVGGCMFHLDRAFGANGVLSLLLLVGKAVVETKARVVYEQPREDRTFEIGVEFIEMAAEDRALLERSFPTAPPPERPSAPS